LRRLVSPSQLLFDSHNTSCTSNRCHTGKARCAPLSIQPRSRVEGSASVPLLRCPPLTDGEDLFRPVLGAHSNNNRAFRTSESGHCVPFGPPSESG
jgi:hypothetical protein